MTPVLNWVKTNVFSVAFLLVMIVTPAAMWVVAGKLNADVEATVRERAAKKRELKSLENSQVKLVNPVAGNVEIDESVVINQRLVDRYTTVVQAISDDARLVQIEASRFNCKDRDVLLDGVFPEPATHERETKPLDMYQRVTQAYAELLDRVNAGPPLSAEALAEELEAARERLITQFFIRKDVQNLDAEDEAFLRVDLTKQRMTRYVDAASQLSMYASTDVLPLPLWDQTNQATLSDLFEWQWQYWITEDMLLGLADANKDSHSLVEGPFKRIVSLYVTDPPAAVADSGGGAGGGGGGGGGFGMSAGGGGKTPGRRGRSAGGGNTPAVPVFNPANEVKPDYTVSFTGRKTNPLYDVRWVTLVAIVETARMPEVFDALARRNFITITNAEVAPVDPFSDLRDGYFYGQQPVSIVTLTLETIWFREWTAPYMPPSVKVARGIPSDEPNPDG